MSQKIFTVKRGTLSTTKQSTKAHLGHGRKDYYIKISAEISLYKLGCYYTIMMITVLLNKTLLQKASKRSIMAFSSCSSTKYFSSRMLFNLSPKTALTDCQFIKSCP